MGPGRRSAVSLLVLMSFVLLVIASSSAAAASKQKEMSAPMRVVTEGFTAQEHLQIKADLSRRLLEDLPANAPTFRVTLTAKEVSAIDHPKRSVVPLKIGLVKPVAPQIEVLGLSRSQIESPRSRGKSLTMLPARDGGLVWAAVLSSQNAGAIRLHITNMSLPNGVDLYFYSRNGQGYGPYAGRGPNGDGDFWTATIFGSDAILQLRVSEYAARLNLATVSFRVPEAGLITPRFSGNLLANPEIKAPPPPGWPCGNPNCVLDASCYNGVAATLSNAVAKMEWVQGAYIYTCTGGLITDNNPTQSNFFLTANHCISKAQSAKNVNLYWKFKTSSCNASSCPTNGGWPYETTGATVSATNRKGDFTLMHLNTNPPAGSVTLGWTSTAVANTNGTKLYRVSNPNFGPQVYSEHTVDTSAPTCSSWPRGERIYSRDTLGAIDGGSSGSPIVNGNAEIVGQLSGTCGTNPSDPCSSGPGEANATVDGAFAFYFSSVRSFLNP